MEGHELENLLQEYSPNSAAREYMSRVALLGVVGLSYSGKSTLADKLADSFQYQPGLHRVVGDTSRQPRPDEKRGVDYHFRKISAMTRDLEKRRLVNGMVFNTGDFYATRPNQYSQDRENIMIIAAHSVQTFKELGLKSLRLAFVVPQYSQEWPNPFTSESIPRDKLVARQEEAIVSYAFALFEKKTNPGGISFILNDKISPAYRRLIQFYFRDKPDSEAKAHDLAVKNLEELKSYF
jgi:hypothetical protein